MTTARPLIGVTTPLERADEDGWIGPYALLPEPYLAGIVKAGGIPVLLPPQPAEPEVVDRVLRAVDGLVLSGGADVDPALYGAVRDPRTDEPRPRRDAWERALVLAALERDQPVLAICRGVQLLNVALGGTLHQHLPAVTPVPHGGAPGEYLPIEVTVDAGSRLAAILPPEERIEVRCHHHQALDRIADGLVVVARSRDGVTEAVESTAHAFAVGVQWHPEEHPTDRRLLAALVGAARAVVPA